MVVQELNDWLETVVQWQQRTLSLTTLLDQATKCPLLASFLQNLRKMLTEKGSVDSVLKEMPQVGQLLGRLTTIKVVMCHPDSYRALMDCILFFYVKEPRTPVETRAQQWVVSQVRGAVCATEGSDVNVLFGTSGITQHQIHIETVKKVISGVFDEDSGSDSVDNPRLCEAASLCLHLSHIPDMSVLLETLVCHVHTRCPHTAHHVYQVVTDSQKAAFSGGVCGALSYRTQLTVWTSYLPSVEQEVVLLVDACCSLPTTSPTHRRHTDACCSLPTTSPTHRRHTDACCSLPSTSPQHVKDLLQQRHLVQACAESLPLYETVFGILKALYWDTGGSHAIGRLIGVLHGLIRQYCNTQQSEMSLSLRGLVPARVQPVVSVMDTNPSALSQSTLEYKLQQVSEQLGQVNTSSSGGDEELLQWVLLQHQDWAHAALLVALVGTKQTSEACCDTMLFFSGKDVTSQDKVYLREVVLALRALMMKSRVQWDDVQCVLFTTHHDTSHTVPHTLLGELLIVFATHAVGANHLVGQILQQTYQCSTATSKLKQLVDILEPVAELWQGNLHLSPLRIQNLVELLTSMKHDATQSSTQCPDGPQDTESISSCLSKCCDRLRTRLNQL